MDGAALFEAGAVLIRYDINVVSADHEEHEQSMARPVTLRAAGAPQAPEWQRNREVVRLTKEILALEREGSAKVVAVAVEMGDKMRRIQAALEPGQWLSWVATAVPFDPRTIQRTMRLSVWAEENPQELRRLEHLGATKLYMLAPLDPNRRRELTGRVPLVIPGRVVPKTVELMTTVELGKVIGGLATRPTPKKPIGTLVQGLEHRIAGVDAVADELVRRHEEVDAEEAEAVMQALREVLEQLEGAFGE